MSKKPTQANSLESAISIGLLGVLFVIAVAVLLKQHLDADMSRFGIESTAAGLSAQMQKPDGQEQTRLHALAPAGFQTLGITEEYTAENLYEKIDGKADFYLNAGFEKSYTQRFLSKGREQLWMELFVYDMGTLRNAFSVYSRQKRPQVRICPELQFGYKTDNALYFVHGRYYIELIGSSEAEQLIESTMEVAQKIRTFLSVDTSTDITELSIFPPENLIPHSFKLYPDDTFGFEGLTDTFTAQYKFDDESITAFLSKRSEPKDAESVAQRYHSFLIDSGCSNKTTTNQTLANLKAKVVDSYGATEIIFVAGPFVAGVHEADNQPAAEKLAEILATTLTSIPGQKE